MFVCQNCHSANCGMGDLHPMSRGACEGCGKGASCFDCHYHAPAPRTVPGPASALLRRLHEEATTVCLCGLPTCNRCRGRSTAKLQLRNALLALADLVKETEALGCHECGRSRIVAGKPCEAPLCRSLAALRERLEAR